MNFKTFFRLKESPDQAYTNDGEWLNPGHSDARTFGWFAFITEVQPFLICSTRGRKTHWDLYQDFFQHLSHKPTPSTPPKGYYIPNYPNIVKQLKKTKHWGSISKAQLVKKLENSIKSEEAKNNHAVAFEIESVYRTKIFQNSGRIWLNERVISFWNKQGEVPSARIFEILDLFEKSPEDFYIDVVNINKIEDEESDRKVLPTVKEYLSKSFTDKGSEQGEKKYQELLAKKHVETNPTERKRLQDQALKGAEKEWGSTKVAKDVPLSLRQKAFTSESLFDY